jgi:hypothetical protein
MLGIFGLLGLREGGVVGQHLQVVVLVEVVLLM